MHYCLKNMFIFGLFMKKKIIIHISLNKNRYIKIIFYFIISILFGTHRIYYYTHASILYDPIVVVVLIL